MRKLLPTIPLVLLLAACGPDDSDSSLNAVNGPSYLAIGDSITFGYNPLVDLNDENVAAGKFPGFPETLGDRLGYSVSNAGCPGETTSSFLDRNGPDNGCHTGSNPTNQYLKVEYSVNQIDYAMEFLRTHLDTRLVTLTIGGNDVLMVESACNEAMIPALCKASKIPEVIVTFGKNLVAIMKGLRATGYTGDIVFVSNYARDYKDPVQKIALGLLDAEAKTLAVFHRFKVASGFKAFETAAKNSNGDVCEANLAIALPEGGCNPHPSAKGREVLAQAVLDVLAK